MEVGGEVRRDPTRAHLILLSAAVFVVAVLPVAIDLSRPAGLYGVTQYDDGVYFGAALRLVDWVLPYRDFALVQPPGITLVLAPFAVLSHLVGIRHALGAARIFTAIVEGFDAVLVVALLRRGGLLAAGVGGLLFAVFPPAYAADHTFLLEPFLDFGCLLGVALLFPAERLASRRRSIAAGVVFAAAGAVKTFAIVPFAVVLIAICSVRRWGQAGALLVGAVLGSALFVLPFFLAAPHAFYHDVITSQIGRSTQRPTPTVNRIYAIVGLSYSSLSTALSLPKAATLTWVVGAIVAAIVVVAVLFALRRGASLFDRVVVVLAIVVTATMFFPAAYYDHYALFSAPFLALVIGSVVGRLSAAASPVLDRRPQRRPLRSQVVGVAAALVVLFGTGIVLESSVRYDVVARVDHFGDPGPAIEATVPDRGCILSDSESLLVSAGRADPGPSGCPALLDATGTWLSIDPLNPPENSGAEPKNQQLVTLWKSMFERADYVVLSGICAFRIPWTPSLSAYFDANFTTMPGPYGLAFARGRPATAAAGPNLASRCAATRAARAAAG